MKVLVVGRGWTGKKVYNELLNRNIHAILTSSSESHSAIKFGNFDWVVNCAGVTGVPNVDACEDDPHNTMDGNATFPILLHRAATKAGAKFMHWSSGCIYEGKIDSVDAAPNFFGSIYSISKGISDSYLKDKAVVIRIRMPFSSKVEDKNIINKILNYSKNGALYNTGQNSMTDHDEAVRVSVDLLIDDADVGPYNLVNTGTLDMYEISKIMNMSNIRWRTTDEFLASTKCQRSTCQIPSYKTMRPLELAFNEALRKCYW